MYKLKLDMFLNEIEFFCPFCGVEQFCDAERQAMTHCPSCAARLYPNPLELFKSGLYRKCYHFTRSEKENLNDKQKESTLYQGGKTNGSRGITSYFHERDQAFLTN